MRLAAPLLLLLLGSSCVLAPTAAAADPDQYYTNAPRDVLGQVPDLSLVSKVRFYVSDDQGKTWKLMQEVNVPEGATTQAHYEFRPTQDGSYIIATCAVNKTGKSEDAPAPGTVPPHALHLVVDTIKPVIAGLNASLDHAVPDQAVVAVVWTATDLNFGTAPVEVAASTDGGATWPVTISGAAQGTGKLTLATGRNVHTVLVRLTATDLAGNATVSDPVTVQLPLPPDPQVELAKAVAQLPPVTEIIATDQSLDLGPAGQHPAAAPASAGAPAPTAAGAPAAGDASAATGAPTGAAAAGAPATAAAAHQDIVVPETTSASLEHPADGGFVTGTSLESAFHAREATAASTDTSGTWPPAPAPAPAPLAPAPTPAGEAPPAPEQTESLPFIPNPDAGQLLAQAEEQAHNGDRASALATFERLHQSGQAVAAITEELALRQEMGDQAGIVATVDHLAPEFVGDPERLAKGRALMALSQPQLALGTLARVHAGAAEAREALWLMAIALRDLHKPAPSQHVLEALAKGDDAWAERARTELSRTAP